MRADGYNYVTADDIPTHKDALKILYPLATHWMVLGTLLGIEYPVLCRIKYDEVEAVNRLQKMLAEWLKLVNTKTTWNDLAEAVQIIDPAKAKEIRDGLVSYM